ncbi:MAG TPA: lipid II flippase MurJ, partial [Candidatus Acidoferrales bacterium]|nr:lipid II flippase MurJ [Candidatus Acidoferrales bacterium]
MTKVDMDQEQVEGARSSVARNASIISLAVMASRVLGLIRDQVFAALFGAGLQYDAFLTAFRIPNLLRDLFAEGALSAAFVTTFTQA